MATTTYTIPSIADIRDRILEDQRRQLVAAGVTRPDIGKGSERWVRAEAVSSAILEAYAREVSYQDATMPDTATGDDLLRLASLEGVTISPGAGASGYVTASCNAGTSYIANATGTTPDGLTYKVVSTTTVDNGGTIPVVGVDAGTKTNKPSGTVLTWTSPPAGSATTATVGYEGLRYGENADTESDIRTNIIDRRQHPVGGGNWAQVRLDAEEASKSIETAFVYPAVYGPCTYHVAITVPAKEEYLFTRAASSALTILASSEVTANHPEHADLTLTTVADLDTDIVLQVVLPEPKAGGGMGGGWVNTTTARWPYQLNVGTPYAVTIQATPTNPKQLRVTTNTEPRDGAYIAVWSSSHKSLHKARIYSHSNVSSTTWLLTLYSPIDYTKIASGDYVMPDSEKLADYCKTLAAAFAGLGPGQKTTDTGILPRSYRRPLVEESWPSQLGSLQVGNLSVKHPEMSNIVLKEWKQASPADSDVTLPVTCPAVSSASVAPPYVLRIGKIAFYP